MSEAVMSRYSKLMQCKAIVDSGVRWRWVAAVRVVQARCIDIYPLVRVRGGRVLKGTVGCVKCFCLGPRGGWFIHNREV